MKHNAYWRLAGAKRMFQRAKDDFYEVHNFTNESVCVFLDRTFSGMIEALLLENNIVSETTASSKEQLLEFLAKTKFITEELQKSYLFLIEIMEKRKHKISQDVSDVEVERLIKQTESFIIKIENELVK